MSQKKIEVKIITPEKTNYTISCHMVVAPGIEGEIGIMYGHQELMTNLQPGKIVIYDSDEACDSYFIQSGTIYVTHNLVTILTEKLLPLKEISYNDVSEKISILEQECKNTNNILEQSMLLDEINFQKDLLMLLLEKHKIKNDQSISK